MISVLMRDGTAFETRYSPGGEEFVLVELDEAMSLETNLLVQQVATDVEGEGVRGIIDVCPANVSYLVRYDPDVLPYAKLVDILRRAEARSIAKVTEPFGTRIVDIPILFQDPWTHDVLMKFRDRVQDPESSDIEYLTRANGLPNTDALIAALTSTPHLVTMTGFVPGVVWSYQLVNADRQLQGPKYLRPRTETPDRAFALGGAFTAIYPAPSAGGYPLVGRAAAPVYDPTLRLPDFVDRPELVRLGDIYNYRPIDRAEYDSIGREVAAGSFRYKSEDVVFEPAQLLEDADAYCSSLKEVLYS